MQASSAFAHRVIAFADGQTTLSAQNEAELDEFLKKAEACDPLWKQRASIGVVPVTRATLDSAVLRKLQAAQGQMVKGRARAHGFEHVDASVGMLSQRDTGQILSDEHTAAQMVVVYAFCSGHQSAR
jgi:hypothetical protein